MPNNLIAQRRKSVKVFSYETLDWEARVNTAGGTVSSGTRDAVERFVLEMKAFGLWALMQEIAIFAGSNLAASLVKLKHAGAGSMTNVNFVAGDYTEATGLTGDGTTKYLNTGFGANNIAAASHLSFYQRTDNAQTGNRACLGVLSSGAAEQFWLGSLNPSIQVDGRLGLQVTANSGTPMIKGFYLLQRASTVDLQMYRNNSSIGSALNVTAHNPPALNLFAWAWNNNGAAGGFNASAGSFLSIGAALTAQQRSDFYLFVQRLQTSLGRAV